MSFATIMPKRDFAKEADDLTHSHFEKNPKVSVQGAQLRDLFSMHLWT